MAMPSLRTVQHRRANRHRRPQDMALRGFQHSEQHMPQSSGRFGFVEFAETWNGRAAMLGFVIGIINEGLNGAGVAHQIGLGAQVDGYVACRTQFLPFCF